MEHHVAEYLLRVLVVVAELRASVVVGEGEDAVDSFSAGLGVEAVYDLLCDSVDASYGRDYPQFVAYAGLSVRAQITFKSAFSAFADAFLHGTTLDAGIVELSFEVGLYVVVVKKRSLSDVVAGMADREAVFDDVFILLDVGEGELVTCRNIRFQGEGHSLHIHVGSRLKGRDGYRHVVGRIDLDIIFHVFSQLKILSVFLKDQDNTRMPGGKSTLRAWI